MSTKEENPLGGEVHISWDEISSGLGRKIASGRYGTVYKATIRGQSVAVKKFHLGDKVESEKLDELVHEVEILRTIRHPNVALFMAVCTEPKSVSLVMEYVDGKSLDDILSEKNCPTLPQRLRIAKDVARGVNWLHCLDPPILHRDLKPPNILVDRHLNVKVCDFGLSCVHEIKPDNEEVELAETAVGTPIWMAPEVLDGFPNTEKSDVYAFGIILWEILTLESPFLDVTSYQQFLEELILEHKRPRIPSSTLPSLAQLIMDCWAPEPTTRPSFASILKRMDTVYIESAIEDSYGVQLWKNLSKYSKRSDEYPYSVDWNVFRRAFFQSFDSLKRSLDGYTMDDVVNKITLCLRILLAKNRGSLVSASKRGKKVVHCEDFGKFLGWFGPMDGDLLQRIFDVCGKRWFHGNINSSEAEQRLAGKRRGTFLVRLSQNEHQGFTISRVKGRDGQSITHQRFHRRGDHFTIVLDGRPERYYSLLEMFGKHSELKAALHLKHSCPGSDFAIVWLEVDGEYVGGAVTSPEPADLSPKSDSGELEFDGESDSHSPSSRGRKRSSSKSKKKDKKKDRA